MHVVEDIRDVDRRKIDVPRRTAGIECGQQRPTLEHEAARVGRATQAVEETFERVKLEQLIGWSPG